jgi:hypothetical protein
MIEIARLPDAVEPNETPSTARLTAQLADCLRRFAGSHVQQQGDFSCR